MATEVTSVELSASGTKDLPPASTMKGGQQQVLTYKKRGRHGVAEPSPKKFKTILGGKIPTLHAEALGLTEAEDDVAMVTMKKKVGRPLGSKNKGPRPHKKAGLTPLRLTYPVVTATQEIGPKAKGKGKL